MIGLQLSISSVQQERSSRQRALIVLGKFKKKTYNGFHAFSLGVADINI
jgi:hypothetical protein